MEEKLTHFDDRGDAIMVDVSGKKETERTAHATGVIEVSPAVLKAVLEGSVRKGDVLGVARLAGIMALKRTFDLIPLCHVLPLDACRITFEPDQEASLIRCDCFVSCHGRTGVEMEAMVGASTALLTIYDMCKAIDKRMVIREVHLVTKTGGKSGDFNF